MYIHKEGRKILLLLLIILAIINLILFCFVHNSIILITVIAVSSILYALMLNFFRKSNRVYKGDLVGMVNSPADGKIVAIERIKENKFFNDERIQISIFMSFFNAQANWMSVTGKIVHFSRVDGNFRCAFLPKSSHENEHTNILIDTPDNHRILVKQIAGAVARRIVTYVKEGEKLHIGEPLGFIKLGSRMDVLLPVDSDILVQIGDKVRANQTFLAHLPK